MNQSEKLSLLRYLGELFSHSEYQLNNEFCRLAKAAGLEAFLYCRTEGKVANMQPVFRKYYQCQRARQLRNEFYLQQLYALLEQEKLSFVPIKGADLAFRVYPNPAMRPFGDFDIWVRHSDLKRFCEILKKSAWHCDLDCCSDHHVGIRYKDNCILEPHFRLPNFQTASEEMLWRETAPVQGRNYQRRLSPELNLIMLFQHNSIDSYQMSNLFKLLLDMEYLLENTPVNWARLTTLCVEYKVPHPGLLLSAFPEFFHSRHDCDINFAPEIPATLRALLLPSSVLQYDRFSLNCKLAHPFHYSWWKTQLSRLSSANLRWKYPDMGDGKLQLHLYRSWDLLTKISLMIHYLANGTDGLVKKHLQQQKTVDESWEKLKNVHD